MAATGRPALMLHTLLSPFLSRLSFCAISRLPNSNSRCPLILVRHTGGVLAKTFYSPKPASKIWQVSPLVLGKAKIINDQAVLSHGKAFGRRRSWSRHNPVQLTQLRRSSSSPSPGNAMLSENVVEDASGPIDRNFGNVLATTEGVHNSSGEAQGSVSGIAQSSRKSKRTCYYHSQELCTMMDDPLHLAKFCHEFPDLSVRGEDLNKVKAQPFDYFLVLDLEGMVEILEFPVVMINAKTLQVVDRFHRFVRPAKMTEERTVDYIRNKYGRWGLDRVWHDTAIPFTDVLSSFERWLESHGLWDPQSNVEKLTTAAFVTCGNWDVKTKIPEQCTTSEIDLPVYFNEWINLKDIYFNFYKFRASGMLKMMKGLKLPMVGTHHVGLDDAHNIARVLQRMLVHGALIQITAKRKAGNPKAVKFSFRFRIK